MAAQRGEMHVKRSGALPAPTGVRALRWKMFALFLKIGAFTFGGGYAMAAVLETEFVEKRGWLTSEEFLDMLAIAESTPGPIAVNSATFLGYRMAGVTGAALCTLGVCLPSFAAIYLISLFFEQFLALRVVAAAFRGIRVCVVYLIASAGLRLLRQMKKTRLNILLAGGVFVLSLAFSLFAVRFSSIWFILLCGAAGVLVYVLRTLRTRKEGGI